MKNNSVVILEKDSQICKACEDLLKGKGYIIKAVSDLDQLLEADLKTPFHVFVIDFDSLIDTKEIIDFLKRLKKQRVDSYIILIVSDVSVDTFIDATTAGADAVIRKPFNPEQIVSVIDSYFQRLFLIEEYIKTNTLIPLYELTEQFIMTESEDKVFQLLIKAIRNHTGADRISIMTYDEKKGVLRIKEAIGLDEDIVKTTELKPGESIAGWVFEKKRPLIINGVDVPDDIPEYYKIKPLLKKKDLVSMCVPIVCIPIYIREKSLGVVNISKKKDSKPFTKSDMEMVFVICRQAALAIENIRSQEERVEKLRIKTILEQYMAPEIAELLISSGKDPISLGEIKDVVILFADIKDFTLLVQTIPINTTRNFLNEFFGLLTEAVFKFHGTLDKFIGDAALAIFGSPIPVDKPAHSAISAAIEIKEAFTRLRNKWKRQELVFQSIGIGIGITAGKVFIGNVGTEKRFDFTVIGLDVNLAQRLASDAKDGEILISEKVKEQLDDRFAWEQITSYHLKGIERPITIYAIK